MRTENTERTEPHGKGSSMMIGRKPGVGKVSTTNLMGGLCGRAVRLVLIASPLIYIALWNLVIRNDLLSMLRIPFRLFSYSMSQEWAKVHVSARPEVVVWRRGFIPVYWSDLGNLIPFHQLFSLGYLFYIAFTMFNMKGELNLNIKDRFAFLNLGTIKKFWLFFGIVAFLTTSLSTVAFLADLLSLVYYVAYLAALPLVPLSLYLWGKNAKGSDDSPKKK